jgi:hypothetical protein
MLGKMHSWIWILQFSFRIHNDCMKELIHVPEWSHQTFKHLQNLNAVFFFSRQRSKRIVWAFKKLWQIAWVLFHKTKSLSATGWYKSNLINSRSSILKASNLFAFDLLRQKFRTRNFLNAFSKKWDSAARDFWVQRKMRLRMVLICNLEYRKFM